MAHGRLDQRVQLDPALAGVFFEHARGRPPLARQRAQDFERPRAENVNDQLRARRLVQLPQEIRRQVHAQVKRAAAEPEIEAVDVGLGLVHRVAAALGVVVTRRVPLEEIRDAPVEPGLDKGARLGLDARVAAAADRDHQPARRLLPQRQVGVRQVLPVKLVELVVVPRAVVVAVPPIPVAPLGDEQRLERALVIGLVLLPRGVQRRLQVLARLRQQVPGRVVLGRGFPAVPEDDLLRRRLAPGGLYRLKNDLFLHFPYVEHPFTPISP